MLLHLSAKGCASAAGGLWLRLQVQQRGVEGRAQHPRHRARRVAAHEERQPGALLELCPGVPAHPAASPFVGLGFVGSYGGEPVASEA